MANNRMYLTCSGCGDRLYMAKYYPSSGWYPTGGGVRFEDFLEQHSPCRKPRLPFDNEKWITHGENPDVMSGVGFTLEYEVPRD